MRRRRQRIAALLLFVFAFAQAVMAAHACPVPVPSPVSSPPAAHEAGAVPGDCADMAKHAGSSAELCGSHCFGGQQVTAQADAPLPLAAPQSPLTVRIADPLVAVPVLASTPRPIGAVPPPLLLSGRLLI